MERKGFFLFLICCLTTQVFFTTAILGKQGEDLGLVGYWRFDEKGGLLTQDASGDSNHGELVGSPLRKETSTGEIGGNADIFFRGSFLELNGQNNYVKVKHSEELSLTKMLTIECWIRPSNWSDNMYQTFIAKGAHLSQRVNYLFGKTGYVYAGKNKNVLKFTYNNGTWQDWIDESSFKIIDGKWYHVAVTVNEEANNVTFWINSKSIYTAREAYTARETGADVMSLGDNFTTKPITVNEDPLYIGANGKGEELYNGAITEIRIYNRLLTADEIKKHFLDNITNR